MKMERGVGWVIIHDGDCDAGAFQNYDAANQVKKLNQNFIGFREFNLEDFLLSILQKTLNYGEMICNEYF